ncbi:hypothetical protein BGZ73_000006 [Actinomortierella ambigua]|nr:hypothetical protein BGZ73_000006 [Actinomortierella ambigua]
MSFLLKYIYPTVTEPQPDPSQTTSATLSPPTLDITPPTLEVPKLNIQGSNSDDSDDSDSDADSDNNNTNIISVQAAPDNSTPALTLSTSDAPDVERPSFPALNGPQRLAACSTDPKSKRRLKFALAPGHSPLDWARLTTSGKDLRGGVTSLGRYTLSDLKQHRTREDAWTALNGVVYNITPYLPFHPGGEKEIMRCAGRDGTKLFNLTHKWVNYEYMLRECQIGFLVHESSGHHLSA